MMRPALAILAAICAVALHGCAASQSQHAAYDGETLYRGLLFGVGPAAKEFPEIWQRDETRCLGSVLQSREAEQFRRQVIDRVRASDPELFRTFAAEMQSGDHLRVRAALERAGDVTRKAVHDVSGGADSATFEQGLQATSAKGITITTIIHIYSAIAEIRYLWIWNDWWVPNPDLIADGRPTPQLRRDVLVDLIVRRLSAPAPSYRG